MWASPIGGSISPALRSIPAHLHSTASVRAGISCAGFIKSILICSYIVASFLYLFHQIFYMPRIDVRVLLACIFFLSLIMNSVALDERFVNDFGWHSSIAREFYAEFPRIPAGIPLMRQGVDFTYPPLSYLLAAFAKHLFPGVRLIVLMRYIVLFSAALSVFPVYLVAQRLFKRQGAALCSAFLFAVSPLPSAYYQYAQAVAFPLVMASVFFLLRALDEGRFSLSALAGVFLGIGYWTHVLPSLFIGAVIGVLSFFYVIRRNFRLAFFSLSVILVSLPFLGVYLATTGLAHQAASLGSPPRLSLIFIPGKFEVVGNFLYERFLLLGLGIAGIVLHLRARPSPPLLSFLFLSFGLAFAGYAGIYVLAVPFAYLRFLIVALSLFGGLALSRLFSGAPGWRGVIFAVFFVYSLYVAGVTGERYVGMSDGDVLSFAWMRENIEPSAVIASDNGHAFWIPFAANRSTINGRKLDEFYVDSRDIDVARIFSAQDAASRLALMGKYGSRYVFYSNDSSRPYPRLTMEDRWGESPAWDVWYSAAPFIGPPLRTVYSSSGDDFVAVYEA